MGHKKADCLGLTGGAVRTPALATMRITDDCEGRVETPVGSSRAFQLQIEEIRLPSAKAAESSYAIFHTKSCV